MKKLLFCFLVILFYRNTLASMRISYKLPSNEVLTERFKKAQLNHFYTHNKLENNLADHFLTPLQALSLIRKAIDNYMPYFYIADTIAIKKFESCIMQTILKDSPQAVLDLKHEGYIENIRDGYKPLLILKHDKVVSWENL